jgi:hypothetical protein
MVYHSENTRAHYTFPVLRVFDIRGDSQERSPRVCRLYVVKAVILKDELDYSVLKRIIKLDLSLLY